MIEMKNVLDPHRYYKKENRKGKLPAFSQTSTVIEGPTEWYSSRLQTKDRTMNFVEEAMAIERATGRFRRKSGEIQGAKTSGKKAHYKNIMADERNENQAAIHCYSSYPASRDTLAAVGGLFSI